MMSEDGTLFGAAQKSGRRRRPSGEPPPLVPRLGWQRWAWGLLGVALLGVLLAIGEATGALTGIDRAVATPLSICERLPSSTSRRPWTSSPRCR